MFKHVGLRARIILALFLVATVGGLISAAGVAGMHMLANTIQTLTEKRLAFSDLADKVQTSILNNRRYEKDYFLNIGSPETQAKYLQSFRSDQATLKSDIDILARLADQTPGIASDETSQIDELRRRYDAYVGGVKSVSKRMASTPSMTPQQANQAMLPYKEHFVAMEEKINLIKMQGDKLTNMITMDSDKIQRRFGNYMIAISLIGFFLSILIGTYIAAIITRPLAQLTMAANKMREGNWHFEITHRSTDETGLLADAFRGMAEAMQKKVDFAQAVAAGKFDTEMTLASDHDILGKALQDMSADLKEYMLNLREAITAQERAESELRLAADIQKSVLPQIFPPFPDRPEFDVFAVMAPAKEVAGDFYDFFFVDERHFCFLIGDVSGKGAGAALFMMVAKTLLKTEALRDPDPKGILARVNDLLFRDNDSFMFVTIFCAILDTETGELRFANGGHNPPLLYSAETSFQYMSVESGFVVGPMPNSVYATQSLTMKDQDLIFLYTDGVTEARNPQGKFFGEERLREIITTQTEPGANDSVNAILAAVKEFASGAIQNDDITMLALKFHKRA